MATIIMSDQMVKPYSQFITDALQQLANSGINKIAVVGLADDGTALTGYYGMDTMDIAATAQHLQFDAIDKFIYANLERYSGMLEEYENDDFEGR